MTSIEPRVTAIATAVPALDFDANYHSWVARQLDGRREASLYARMAARSGIARRWSVLEPEDARLEEGEGLYSAGPVSTGRRMELYARHAPQLALQAIGNLGSLEGVTHLVVASCTGFVAPGIDQIIARSLRLSPNVERTFIGFMGCYAAVTALRNARHIVRSEPGSRVLVVTIELSSLHHQEDVRLEALLARAQFGDGAAAAIVEATGEGLSLGEGLSVALDDTEDLITWHIADTGFVMHLSGEVPSKIVAALSSSELRCRIGSTDQAFAVHAGGRSILDAVERGLDLRPTSLDHSRGVLHDYGNMSSSTLMFVLARTMRSRPQEGTAMAFGPGLAVEGFRFGWIQE